MTRSNGRNPAWLRRPIATAIAAGVALILTGCLDETFGQAETGSAESYSSTGDLVIHNVNVGQGQATLVIGPDGTTMLVDGGRSNMSRERLMPYLDDLGIAGVDYVVLTHRDSDHMTGLTELFEFGYDATFAVLDNGSDKMNTSIGDFLDAATWTTAGGVDPILLGEIIPLGGGAEATCVAVGGEVLGYGPVSGATSNENDLSVALLIEHGDFDFILGGDLGGGDDDDDCTGRVHPSANVETPLAEALTLGQTPLLTPDGVEVMLINHHGSHSSTNSDYFNLLNPSVALISVGGNSYGHPREVVVDNVLGGGTACIAAPPTLILQSDEGDLADPSASATGHVVGDVVITTTGIGHFTVEASGNIFDGPDERNEAGVPGTFVIDEANGCTADPECDDGYLCTNDFCDAGTGTCQNIAIQCDDGNLCTTDACDPGTGLCDFAPVTCDDGDLCTTDACDPGTGTCDYAPVTCDDDDLCTTDACDPGTGTCDYAPVSCDDGDACTIDSCEAGTGACVYDPDPVCQCTVTEDPEVSCGDGLDNDCDDLTDEADPDCAPTGPVCGNGVCEGNGEDGISCSQDCRCTGRDCSKGNCGDGICSHENGNNCPIDCGG